MKHFQSMARVIMLMTITTFLQGGDAATTSPDMVQDIQHRYYLIRRLEKSIAVLATAQSNKGPSFTPVGIAEKFVHPATRNAMHAMEVRRSVVPFYKVWGEFLSYRFIHNKDFVREVLTTLLLLYRELIVGLVTDKTERGKLTLEIDQQIEHLFAKKDPYASLETAVITLNQGADMCYRATNDVEKLHELNEILTGHHTLTPIHQGTGDIQAGLGTITHLLGERDIADVVLINNMRFYHIQRMLKSMFTLAQRAIVVSLDVDSIEMIKSFKCPTIQACFATIQDTKSVEPLLNLWSQFSSYDFINDEQLLQEFIQLTVLVYHQSITSLGGVDGETVISKRLGGNPKDLLMMYEKISTLPIPELLNLLDDVVEQYDALANSYELRNNDLTWGAWFKKYWWAVPVITGSMLYTLLKHTELLAFLR